MPVGEAFLSAFLQVLFDRLTPKHIPDFLRGSDIENDLKTLKRTLKKVNAVLNDAEVKQFKDDEVKMWLDEVKDAAYDAEDVLEEFATEALRRKLEAESETSSNQVWSLLPASLNPSVHFFNVEIEAKIKAIIERLDGLANERFELGLKEVAAGSSSRVRETSSVVDESRVHGRDDDKEKIMELLLKDDSGRDNKFSVIPIVGMGGVGKTTLAQILYNDNRVEKHFNLKAWTCVSEEFDVKRITKSILKSVGFTASDSDDLNMVQIQLKPALTGKKFLIVLDDVWSKNYEDWDVLQNPFRVGAAGSKIIVTTRIRDVALMMRTADNYYDLEHLSKDHCWSVFAQHAFGSGNIDTKPNLAIIGEKIVEKCKGLPLAAKTLGGLLRSKQQEEDEWEDILNSKIWELPENESGVIPALKLSYHHLPSHLKRYFAYCSIFPKDYEFKEVELVRLWMAEGLVQQPNGRKQMEDLAVEYFCDLLSRSFFQVSSSNKSLFVMHDLINDLAECVAGETCFRLEDMLEGSKRCEIFKKARHSSFVSSELDGVKKFEAFDKAECLRTFLPLKSPFCSYLTQNVPLRLLPKLRWLRVLSLAGYQNISELPDKIGDDLKYLRYLNLSDTQITCLPESTSTLYNLQMLILNGCRSLKKLPTSMGNLINLRLLDIKGTNSIKEMPQGVSKLTSLRELSNFIVGKNCGSGIRELMNLKCLRGRLCISRLENVTDAHEVREAILKDKQDLVGLTVEWSFEFNESKKEEVEKDVLDMLQPHKKLKLLTIKCYGGTRFPTWIGDPSFSNMVTLNIKDCVKCTSLPPLGLLSSLKDLCIEGMNKVNSVGLEFFGEGCSKPFPSLEILSFADMKEWKDWFPSGVDWQVEAFPCLRKLSIRKCPKLSGKLPDHLPSLEELNIFGCQQLVVSISSLPELCEFNVEECQEVVHRSTVHLSSLKSMHLSNISKLMCLTEGFMRGLTRIEDLEIVGCEIEMSLYQKEEGLLQHLTSLRHLRIRGCPKFVFLEGEDQVVQQQLGLPCGLESLELESCDNLETLQGLNNLTYLRRLRIKGCPRLASFPETSLPSTLREIIIESCDGLKSVPQAMKHCSKFAALEYLCIVECNSLTSIARDQLPSTLKILDIRSCVKLHSLVEEEEGGSTTTSTSILEDLRFNNCPSFISLSSRGGLTTTLKYLEVWDCPKLELVADSFHNNTSLECISIGLCKSLKSLPTGLHNVTHLSNFTIYECPSLVCFPAELPATNLRALFIARCEELEALPHRIHNLTSLQQLTIQTCPGLIFFPEGGFPTNLTSLDIENVKICRPLFEWGLHKLTSLRILKMGGPCPDLVSFPEEKGVILPNSLTTLSIHHFPNLEYLSSKGFQNLSSLKALSMFGCPKLKFLPGEGLPTSVLRLSFGDCPLLEQECIKDQGREWPKIAHIPAVSI